MNLNPSRIFSALASAAIFFFALTPVASAVTINFSDQPTTVFTVFTSDTQKGFTVTPVAGEFVVDNSFGNPVPGLAIVNKSAAIGIVYSDGDFTFTSVDLAGLQGKYTITGLLDGNTVFTASDKITGDNIFNTYNPGFSSDIIDQLEITLTANSKEADLDNIVVNPAVADPSVPEPSSFLLLGTGLLTAAGVIRRRLSAH
jgi:hypothetical protein